MQRSLNPMHDDEYKRTQHARLRMALSDRSELTCEQIQTLLPYLIEAEQARVDVDTVIDNAALLRHLDCCEACMELYGGIIDDLEALAGETGSLPQTKPVPPHFFSVTRQSEHVCLRIIHGFARGFELTLTTPRLAPSIATLSGRTQTPLFGDTLPELPGTPIVAVALSVADETTGNLLVAVREVATQAHWRICITAGETMQTADTDGRGIAQFEGLLLDNIQTLTLSCTELIVEP